MSINRTKGKTPAKKKKPSVKKAEAKMSPTWREIGVNKDGFVPKVLLSPNVVDKGVDAKFPSNRNKIGIIKK